MPLEKNWLKILIAIILATTLAAIVLIIFTNYNVNKHRLDVELYFFDPIKKEIVPEERKIQIKSKEEILGEVINEFWAGPRNNSLSKTTSPKIIKNRSSFDESKGIYRVEFTRDYKDLSISDELIFRTSFVWTLTKLDFIKDVEFFVDGVEAKNLIGNFNKDNILINVDIEPRKNESRQIILYFPSKDGTHLVKENRITQIDPSQFYGEYIVQELSKGPSSESDGTPIFDESVKIRSVTLDTESVLICYVNLSQEFLSSISTIEAKERAQIYSIVNSLTENKNIVGVNSQDIKKVQFFVEGARVQDYKGKIDLSQPIERDESLIE